MEKIDEQLKNISSVEIPTGTHHSIMRNINYRQMWPMFIFVFLLLVLNFLIIMWHINSKLIDAEFSDMAGDFFTGLDLSFDFIEAVLGSFFEIISPALVLSALVSLVGAIYVGKKIKFAQFLKYRNI